MWTDPSRGLSHQPKCCLLYNYSSLPSTVAYPAVRKKGLFPNVLSYPGWIHGKLACWYSRITFLPTSEWGVKTRVPAQCFSTLVQVMGILEIKSDKRYKPFSQKSAHTCTDFCKQFEVVPLWNKWFTCFQIPNYDSPLGHRFHIKDLLY